MRNQDNINRVLSIIEAHPETWDQETWHNACGTAHCFAGHGQILSGRPVGVISARHDARVLFGFNYHEATYYFSGQRTLSQLLTARLPWANNDGYESDGFHFLTQYDRAGYNRKGFNLENNISRDPEGYNRIGYDTLGFDRQGRDMDGFNKENEHELS